ncbi:DNA polymerase II large subunit, partial [Candidatus Thorarchaeota archaeon]
GSVTDIRELRKWILAKRKVKSSPNGDRIHLPVQKKFKSLLEELGIPHEITGKRGSIVLTDSPATIMAQLGTGASFPKKAENALTALSSCSEVILRDKLGFAIGARMGRPEKAEERKMRPPVQVLFPVGRKMATERNMEKIARSSEQNSDQVLLESYFQDDEEDESEEDSKAEESEAELVFMDKKDTTLELVNRTCPDCGEATYKSRCPKCGTHTKVQRWCSQEGCGLPVDDSSEQCPHKHDPNLVRSTRRIQVDIRSLLEEAKEEVDEPHAYNVRAVLGLTNKLKIPEYLGKGILRAKHEVYCYRDGTARFDVTDAPMTHFKPYEVGVSVAKLREMGYLVDHNGESLVSENQTLELKVQDIVVPENGGDYLVRVGRFVDDCLEKIYGLERYYNFKSLDDIVGQLVVGLAPHTSAGIIGRIVGFTNASVCYAHPYWHAAKRRNCDGDEDAIILVLDALINFSKEYLPAGRGRFMDAPLVLSVILNPEEVDDESHNIEVCSRYPAEFYEMVAEAKHPSAAEGLVDIVSSRLGSAAQYEGLGFTHDTSMIDSGPRNSKYKLLGTMAEKLEAQLELASLLDAVDARDVAERVLSHHFIRDIRGNLRAYSTQKIQCRKCHSVYRRIPLSGTCTRRDSRGVICGESLALTVSEKNISKYLSVAEKMISEHDLSEYLKQRLKLINASLDSMFVSEQTAFENL